MLVKKTIPAALFALLFSTAPLLAQTDNDKTEDEVKKLPALVVSASRVPIPALSEERRVELTKIAGKYAEQGRVAVRNVRRDGMEMLKGMEKDSEISKDEHHLWAEEIQKMTDDHTKAIDAALAQKEEEILQV